MSRRLELLRDLATFIKTLGREQKSSTTDDSPKTCAQILAERPPVIPADRMGGFHDGLAELEDVTPQNMRPYSGSNRSAA